MTALSFLVPLPQKVDSSGYQPAAWAAPLGGAASSAPLSFEGGPQRCFRSLFVCPNGINITGHGWPLHPMGLRLAQHYSSQLAEAGRKPEAAGGAAGAVAAGEAAEETGSHEPSEQQQVVSLAAKLAAARAAMQAAEAAAVAALPGGAPLPSNSSGGSAEVLLRVVFHRRSSPDRQLLNAAELNRRCNGWGHTAPDGRRLRAVCWEAEPTDLFSGIAAAQAADIFVGVHGGLGPSHGWLAGGGERAFCSCRRT